MKMNNLIKNISALFLTLSANQLALAAEPNTETNCALATQLAEKSYSRIQPATASGEIETAIYYSKAFWDIFELSPNCPNIQKISVALNKANLGKDANPQQYRPNFSSSIYTSTSTFNLSNFKVPADCKTNDCQLVFTTSGQGSINGLETPKAFLINKDMATELKIDKSQILSAPQK
jgi:hypothetical protein